MKACGLTAIILLAGAVTSNMRQPHRKNKGAVTFGKTEKVQKA